MLRVITLFLLFIVLLTPSNNSGIQQTHQISINQDADLIIYTYDSLFAFPEFDFVTAFEEYANLDSGSVNVVRMPDAGGIITRAVAEKNNPIADVLIGIDNVLVHKAREQEILTPYTPSNVSSILEGLVQGLASDNLLTPYDFGVISLWYDNTRLTDIDTENFTLEDLKLYANKLIVQNPALSSPGLGFLLWTIAVYGDDSIDGIVDGNWENFWREIANDVRIVDSWNTAVELFYTPEANRPMMISYSSSPAFGSCTEGDFTTSALLSHELSTQWGWQQIEGLGLVKNAKNEDLAKLFIDWFISSQVQEQILTSQWIYPVIDNVNIPECYSSAITSDTISPLNNRLSQNIIAENLDNWLDRWEIAIIEVDSGIFGLSFSQGNYFLLAVIPLIILNKRRI